MPDVAALAEAPAWPAVSVELVEGLVTGPLRFSAQEWRVILAVAIAPGPPTARQLARGLGRQYEDTKRTCRALRACRVLTLVRGHGLVVQPDVSRWAVPGTLAGPPPRPRRRPVTAAEEAGRAPAAGPSICATTVPRA